MGRMTIADTGRRTVAMSGGMRLLQAAEAVETPGADGEHGGDRPLAHDLLHLEAADPPGHRAGGRAGAPSILAAPSVALDRLRPPRALP